MIFIISFLIEFVSILAGYWNFDRNRANHFTQPAELFGYRNCKLIIATRQLDGKPGKAALRFNFALLKSEPICRTPPQFKGFRFRFKPVRLVGRR